MEEWKTYKLGDVCSRLSSGRGIKSEEVLSSGIFPVIGGNGIRGYCEKSNFSGICGVIGRQGAYCGNVRIFEGDAYMTEHAVVVVGNEYADTRFLAYLLSLLQLGHLSAQSAQPGLSVQTLSKLEIKLPPLPYQIKVSNILKVLDTKIELNRRINDNLEQQAQALFDSYFNEESSSSEDYTTSSLLDIATYLNGLAMQKYRPSSGDRGLPVLKIKELGQSKCDESSDRCSSSIATDYIVDDGDVIFSWSGTLLVDLWCGDRCGLNQHLFKITSSKYPKWFYYFWTKRHLDNFIRIAKDKAVTMGHIKRGDLERSSVLIPTPTLMKEIDAFMSPLIEQIVATRIESRKLSDLRDSILPKLMSGELKPDQINL